MPHLQLSQLNGLDGLFTELDGHRDGDEQESEEEAETAKHERQMVEFRMQALNPHLSYNIYKELDMRNLQKYYTKSKTELEDIWSFFNITSAE